MGSTTPPWPLPSRASPPLLHGRSTTAPRLAIKRAVRGAAQQSRATSASRCRSTRRAAAGARSRAEFAVDASFCEVYEERVRDLFVNDQSGRSRGTARGAKKEGSFLEVEESSDEVARRRLDQPLRA